MAMTPKERTEFIQKGMTTSFMRIAVFAPDLDLLFWWMFYNKSNLENQFKLSKAKYVKEINTLMDKMPRDAQLAILMDIMKDQTKDQSKKILALLKIYN